MSEFKPEQAAKDHVHHLVKETHDLCQSLISHYDARLGPMKGISKINLKSKLQQLLKTL